MSTHQKDDSIEPGAQLTISALYEQHAQILKSVDTVKEMLAESKQGIGEALELVSRVNTYVKSLERRIDALERK